MSESEPGAQAVPQPHPLPPPAEGVRLAWETVPASVRARFEAWIGSPVVSAASQPTGFSPGVAVRIRTADGQRMFVKAIGPKPNPDSVAMHRREAHITRLLPVAAPVPRLLWSDDDPETGWVVLAFEEIEGRHPAQPWKLDELDRVLAMLATLAETLTPSPLPDGTVSSASEEFDRRLGGWRLLQAEPNPALDAWSRRHLDQLAQIEARSKDAVVGDSLLHFDVRADNLLLSTDKVWLVDWPLACTGAAWVDVVLFAPSVHMQGGPTPEELLARYAAVYPAFRDVDPDAVTAVIVALAGLFIHRSLRPPPPGLPTLRPFQAAQGAVTCAWLARWLGWD